MIRLLALTAYFSMFSIFQFLIYCFSVTITVIVTDAYFSVIIALQLQLVLSTITWKFGLTTRLFGLKTARCYLHSVVSTQHECMTDIQTCRQTHTQLIAKMSAHCIAVL